MKTIDYKKTILIYASFITFFFNINLISFFFEKNDFNFQNTYFLIALFFTIIFVIVIVLAILGQRFVLKPLIIFLLLLSSAVYYFKTKFNVLVNEDVIVSTFDAFLEKNSGELGDILTPGLFVYVIMFGCLPSFLLWKIKITYPDSILEEVFQRGWIVMLCLILFFSLVFVNYKNISLIGRKNHKINTQIIPTYTISSMKNVFKKYYASKRVFKIHDASPKHDGLADKEIMILVVGETARADHFSLGGYNKETNPRLKKEGIKFYNNVTSCGTLTAYSVPCMFYLDKYEDYSPSKAKYQQNVLDLIQSTKGHHVWWLENNSSCKNVCERVNVLDYYKKTQKEYNPNQQDGFLIGETGKILEQYKNDRDDVLIVLHTMGSHGPKYYKRYPKEFETFKPTCITDSPEKCDREHLVNTYDNTIVYTDYVLSELIHLLKKYDGPKTKLGLLYVSDHGESLGEKNIYLHGLPKMLAPKAQTHVPIIEWTNELKNKEPKIIDTALTHEHLPKMLIDFFSINTNLNKG